MGQELLNICSDSCNTVVRQSGVERQSCNGKTCSNTHDLAARQRLRRLSIRVVDLVCTLLRSFSFLFVSVSIIDDHVHCLHVHILAKIHHIRTSYLMYVYTDKT